MVMATGAVAIAGHLLAMAWIAVPLVWLNTAFYLVLAGLTLARFVRHTRAFADDMRDHARGPGFFTIIAGTCILASQYVIILERDRVGFALWLVAAVLWLV